jgi:hypothetical protein
VRNALHESLVALLLVLGACNSSKPTLGASGGSAGSDVVTGPPCGYQQRGTLQQIAANVQVCLPLQVCTPSETCPRGLADCVAGACVFKPGYHGLATLPEAWATYYCDLPSGGCDGSVLNPRPYELAQALAAKYGPVCASAPDAPGTCVGIAAVPPQMAGNSQIARDPASGEDVSAWGLGMTGASGLCYRITGATGTAVIGISDRCAGYCKCGRGEYNECGACINAVDTTPECTCVGAAPPLYGSGCAEAAQCDWCASNNHPHFDLDNATFEHVCGAAGEHAGSCQLSAVEVVEECYPPNPAWPD